MRKWYAVLLALTLSGGVVYGADAPVIPDVSTLNPAALKALIPEKLDWKPAQGLVGADTVTLVGDPAKPGLYIVLNRFQPGHFSPPHYHPNNRYIFVVSGTWWVATGTNNDAEHVTVPMKAGTFVTHLGREVHYDGARSIATEPAVVMIMGEGPATRTDCDKEQGPGPCATARAAAVQR